MRFRQGLSVCMTCVLLLFAAPLSLSAAQENLALGATATADSFYRDTAAYAPDKAVDGSLSTRWSPNDGFTPWLELDLGTPQHFNQVVITEYAQFSGRVFTFDIRVSSDGKVWTPWRQRRFLTPVTSAVGEAVTAQYIRIDFVNINKESINIAEVEVYMNPNAQESAEPSAFPREGDYITQEPSQEPSLYQQRKADTPYGMFIHYGINTFANMEWTDGSLPASTYHPTETLDPDSWVKTAWEGGMDYVVLVTKHHDGFVMFQSAVGDYSVYTTGREEDGRDIVAEVAAACAKYGLKLGLYYSAWDRHWDRTHSTASTGLDAFQLKMAYNDYMLTQISELLSGRYGAICELWIDGAWEKAAPAWEFERLYDTVKRLQPGCQFAVNWTIQDPNGPSRLVPGDAYGGEEMRYFPSDFRLMDPYFPRTGANGDPKLYSHAGETYYLPFEATICMNDTWFANTSNNASKVRTPQYMQEKYNQMVLQHNSLVINLAPGTDGRLADYDVAALYAGARRMGLARGDARDEAGGDDGVVLVRVVDEAGAVLRSTQELRGKVGDAWTAEAPDLQALEYTLLEGTADTAAGTYTAAPQTVTFVYADPNAPIPPEPPEPPEPPAQKWGDVDDSDTVDSTDARMILQYEVKLIPLDDEQKKNADVSGDDNIDSTDARLILQHEVGLIEHFPAESAQEQDE